MGYLDIREYGVIGDMRTAALVSRFGSIDWCPLPRFDSPGLFARILDEEKGGHWSISPAGDFEATHRYEEGTNVLVTRFETGGGILEVTDFMPALEWDRQLASHHEIHRCLRVPGGRVRIETTFRPRFDYAVREPHFRRRTHGILATDGRDEAVTVAGIPGEDWEIDAEAGDARTELVLEAGEARTLILRYDDDEVWPREEYRSARKLERTRSFWRGWSSDLRYEGRHRELVERSALTLKLLFYAPTGAIVAAPTTSLPEVIGGGRNYDYRYSWLRDSTYTLFALYALGKFEELDRYMVYLKKVCRMESEHLQIMFGVGGEPELPERELGHLDGYLGSRPVRVGNAAVNQFQLDVYGEVLDSVHIWRKNHRMTEGMWELVRRLADEVVELWRRPDQGVWEWREEPRHHVFSKVMAWVALDRAVRLAEDLGLEGDRETWRSEREAIRTEVLEKGWNEEKGSFVAHYGGDRLDAAVLALPLVRFLPADDPRVVSTVERVREELGRDGSVLLCRYVGGSKGCGEGEGAFHMSSFQLAQALALAGRHDEAVEVFERAAEYASPLGLCAEQVDPESGRLLGNFPQAFTHIGLVNAAHVISKTEASRAPAQLELLRDAGG